MAKKIEMTVRRWIKVTYGLALYELDRANDWLRISSESVDDYERQWEIAQSQLQAMYDELLIAWHNKPFRFLYEAPVLRSDSILVGDWAAKHIKDVIDSGRYSYLTRSHIMVKVYINRPSLPKKVPPVHLDDALAAIDILLYIERTVAKKKLKPGDKIAIPYSSALFYRIPFNQKDIVEDSEDVAEE